MSRKLIFPLYYAAILFQAGAYGLTFMLPRLFDSFGANEKVVGTMLLLTTAATVITVYFSGHLSDLLGRLRTLGMACIAISASLFLYGTVPGVGPGLAAASLLLGFGWGLTYSLGPIVMSRLVRADERVRYFTLLSVFVMAGFGFAPVIASAMEDAGFTIRDAFVLNGALCLVSAALFLALDRPIKAQAVNARPEAPSRITLAAVAGVLRSPARLPVFMVFLGASIFAGLNNFQTVFADARGLDYAYFFMSYTLTTVTFRLVMARFTGGANPYMTIALLQCLMCAGLALFVVSGDSLPLYVLVAVLFGLGYGVSYPVLVAMAADDADDDLGAQTLQLFALTYFIGIFGFPLVAGWMIVEVGTTPLLILITLLAVVEAALALRRGLARRGASAAEA